MKPLILSADQVRISCQADAFLTHMVNERFEDIAADSQWHVGLHPLADGVRMNVGVHVKGTVNDESFMVRRAFEPYSSTSAIYNGCEEMITQLRRSVDSIFPPDDVDEAIAQDCNQWITHNYNHGDEPVGDDNAYMETFDDTNDVNWERQDTNEHDDEIDEFFGK